MEKLREAFNLCCKSIVKVTSETQLDGHDMTREADATHLLVSLQISVRGITRLAWQSDAYGLRDISQFELRIPIEQRNNGQRCNIPSIMVKSSLI